MKRIRNVMVVELLQAEFEALKTKFNNTFYWCTDTDKLYKGANAIGDGDTPGPGPEPSGNDFVVNYTATEDPETHENVYSADKTFAEISAAIEAGKYIRATDGEGSWFQLSLYDEGREFCFVSSTTSFDGNSVLLLVTGITHTNTNSITFRDGTFTATS